MLAQLAAFAIGIPLDINAFYRSTQSSTSPCQILALEYSSQSLGWAQRFQEKLLEPPTRALRPVNPGNAWTLRITAAAGT
jgi:hypothetical protein